MNNSPAVLRPKRRLLPYILGGCAILSLCLVFACTANAAYWTIRQGVFNSDRKQIIQEVRPDPGSPAGTGASSGEKIFYGEGGCSACHSLEPGRQVVGPSLAGLSGRAAALAPEYTVEGYIYESIVDPNAYVVDGYNPDIMPANYGNRLSEGQLSGLVEFLTTK